MSSFLRSPRIVYFLIVLTILSLFRSAWICDDAFITFRCVLNFLHGYGPTFNVDERVQAFTHPLWFFFLSIATAISGNIFFSAFFLSFVFSALLLAILACHFKNPQTQWLWIGIFLLSRSLLDFSVSGLENPLAHVMTAMAIIFGLLYLEKRQERFAYLSGALSAGIYLVRPDLVLLVAPFAILVLINFEDSRQKAISVFLSIAPVSLWMIFSTLYYGFPLPNTAYAKLAHGIPFAEISTRGLVYLWETALYDPIAFFCISLAIFIGLFRSAAPVKALAIGVLLYLSYIVCIGGDFMLGRFFSTPIVVSLLILNHAVPSISIRPRLIFAGLLLMAGPGLYSLWIQVPSAGERKSFPKSGIVDERQRYYSKTGLLSSERIPFENPKWVSGEKTFYRVCGGLGETGFYSIGASHVIDICGLADPLLARLPSLKRETWRAGHYYRQVPTNYELLLEKGDLSVLTDPKVAEFWLTVKALTRDPVFSKDRLRRVLQWNFTGEKLPAFEQYATEVISSRRMRLSEIQKASIPDANANSNLLHFLYAIEFSIEQPLQIKSIDLSIANDGNCSIEIEINGKLESFVELEMQPNRLNHFRIELPHASPPTTLIRIVPHTSSSTQIQNAFLGHFRVNS